MGFRRVTFWAFAVLGALLALGCGLLEFSELPNTRFLGAISKFRNQGVFSSFSWSTRRFLLFMKSWSWAKDEVDLLFFPHPLLWMAPFLSGGGYCSEAISYIIALASFGHVPHLRVEQHGDLPNQDFWKGLPPMTKNLIARSSRRDFSLNESVIICHSEPGAWYPPLFQTNPCPPMGYETPLYVIGRTMFETDRVNEEHVRRCNRMDEIWIPSEFHRKTFMESGVSPSKLVKVVQAVDVWAFDPEKVKPLPLSLEGDIFGSKAKFLPESTFVFLSIFKWEKRKGWDILIKAYLQEFTAADNVALYILTNAYHTEKVYEEDIRKLVNALATPEPKQGWPALYVTDSHIPQVDLPRLYKAVDAFVLPSRGEGWGRPYVEAMAMSLPVIATNWSGMMEYIADTNSYPLPIDGLQEVSEGPFRGHQWAKPSLSSLRFLMKHVYSNPTEAKSKGALARVDMVEKFSPQVVAKEVYSNLIRIKEILKVRGKLEFLI